MDRAEGQAQLCVNINASSGLQKAQQPGKLWAARALLWSVLGQEPVSKAIFWFLSWHHAPGHQEGLGEEEGGSWG